MKSSFQYYKVNVSVPLRMTVLTLVLLTSLASTVLLWKQRSKFPFKARVLSLVFILNFLVVAGVVNNMLLYVTTSDMLYCDERCWIYDSVFLLFINLYSSAQLLRVGVVYFKHRVQERTMQISSFFISHQLPPGFSNISELQNSWFLSHSSWAYEKNIMKVYGVISLTMILLAAIGMLSQLFWGVNLAAGSQGLGLCVALTGMFTTYKMRNDVDDIYGIVAEVSFVTKSAAAGLIVHFLSYVILIQETHDIGLFMWLQLSFFHVASIRAVLVPYLQSLKYGVNDADATESKQQPATQHCSQTELMADGFAGLELFSVTNTPFKTKACVNMTFNGLISSEQGFSVFLTYLKSEFAAENLLFWLHAESIALQIKYKIIQSKIALASQQSSPHSAITRAQSMICQAAMINKTPRSKDDTAVVMDIAAEPEPDGLALARSKTLNLKVERSLTQSKLQHKLEEKTPSGHKPTNDWNLSLMEKPPLLDERQLSMDPMQAISSNFRTSDYTLTGEAGVRLSNFVVNHSLKKRPSQKLPQVPGASSLQPVLSTVSPPRRPGENSAPLSLISQQDLAAIHASSILNQDSSFVLNSFKLYNLYIKPQSFQEVNLSNNIRRAVVDKLKALKFKLQTVPELTQVSFSCEDYAFVQEHDELFMGVHTVLLKAAADILRLLKFGAFTRFKLSQPWKLLKESVEGRQAWESKLKQDVRMEQLSSVFSRKTEESQDSSDE